MGEGQWKELDSGKKIMKMVGQLEENYREIKVLKEGLMNAETECDRTSSVLLNKLEEVNSLKEEIVRL